MQLPKAVFMLTPLLLIAMATGAPDEAVDKWFMKTAGWLKGLEEKPNNLGV